MPGTLDQGLSQELHTNTGLFKFTKLYMFFSGTKNTFINEDITEEFSSCNLEDSGCPLASESPSNRNSCNRGTYLCQLIKVGHWLPLCHVRL